MTDFLVGKNVMVSDGRHLKKDWGIDLNKWEDSAHAAAGKGIIKDKRMGLDFLLRTCFQTRLSDKDNTDIRCSKWNEKLAEVQIMYAALDVIAGSCIDYFIMATPEPARYRVNQPPEIGASVAYVVGESVCIGFHGDVVPIDTPILSGPHRFPKRYNPSTTVQSKLSKVRVTLINKNNLFVL